jgi:hypothetical protein
LRCDRRRNAARISTSVAAFDIDDPHLDFSGWVLYPLPAFLPRRALDGSCRSCSFSVPFQGKGPRFVLWWSQSMI